MFLLGVVNCRSTAQDHICRCWEILCPMGNGNLIKRRSDSRILLMPYNDLWRSARKIMHQLLTTKSAESYRPFQDVESKQLMWDYLHDPAKFYLHNARYANSGNPSPIDCQQKLSCLSYLVNALVEMTSMSK
jgi:retron-type reverse transcriptase